MYPLNIPNKRPKDLSTGPKPVHVTALPNDLPIKIVANKVIININTPSPMLLINWDSIYSLTHGCNLGTKIIVHITDTIHFVKDKKLSENPFKKHWTIE